MIQPTITVIGGDLRLASAAEAFASDGFPVYCYQTEKTGATEVNKTSSLQEAMEKADVVLLPLPISFDDQTVHMPEQSLAFCDLLYDNRPLFLGGKASPHFLRTVSERHCRFRDYYEREEFKIFNAIPTAEGAIAIAMKELQSTLFGSRCLILGFGRIGKILAQRLDGLGANVTCTARKPSDLAWMKAYGYAPLQTNQAISKLSEFDIIFNTIPSVLLTKKALKQTKPNVLMIDLASKPGGIDVPSAQEMGRKAISALALPGKVAPITSGLMIKDTVLHILREQNIISSN